MKSAISLSLSECAQAETMEMNPITKDYPLKSCSSTEVNKVIPVPKIAYNTYSIRFPSSLLSEDENPSQDLILNLTDHWPTIVSLEETLTRPVETCPLDMHMILWGVTDDLTARIFQSEVSSSYFSPDYGEPIAHYFQYSKNGFPSSSSTLSQTLPPYVETIIKAGEYLFIPNNHLVSLQMMEPGSVPEGTIPETPRTSVLKLCYFDASNVNDVRNALKLESFLSKSSSNLFKQLNSPSTFDFVMVRDPPAETMVNQFRVYPKFALDTKGLDATATSTAKGEESNRRNRGKGDYKGEIFLSLSVSSRLSVSLEQIGKKPPSGIS
jgi:hypothetical protein